MGNLGLHKGEEVEEDGRNHEHDMENSKIKVDHKDAHHRREDVLKFFENSKGANSLSEFLRHRTANYCVVANLSDSQQH